MVVVDLEGRVIEGKYKPQVAPNEVPKPDVLCKSGEMFLRYHIFRNAITIPLVSTEWSHPVSALSFLLSYSPFGKTSLLGTTVLSAKGELTKKLIEYVLNICLGSPDECISLD